MSTPTGLLSQTQAAGTAEGLRRFGTLPHWLTAAADSAGVRDVLTRSIPELAGGALRELDVKRVRNKKNRWTGMYYLTIDGQPEVVRLRGTLIPPGQPEPKRPPSDAPFGADGWHLWLPELRLDLEMQPPDEALPALPRLTDPELSRELLESSIRAGSPAYGDLEIQSSEPKVMRYKPGSRCTILYRLGYAPDHVKPEWPDIVVAKTYTGAKGQNAYEGMRALWESPVAKGDIVTLAEPLAFVPDLNVLVQGPIREEQTLQDMIRSALRANTTEALEELNHYMRMTAVALAELHQSGIATGEQRTWQDELDEVHEVDDRLTGAIPELAGAATPLLTRLEGIAAEHPADPSVPAHGTFRPAQVLIYKGKIGFIDFDGFCQSEPALDLALFLGKIGDIGLDASDDDENDVPMDRDSLLALLGKTKAISEVFLSEYEKYAPVSRQRIALWQVLNIFTLVQHCWTKVKPVRLTTNMLLLERYLSGIGLW